MKEEKKERSRYSKGKFLITFCVSMLFMAAVRHGFSIELPDTTYHNLRMDTWRVADMGNSKADPTADVENLMIPGEISVSVVDSMDVEGELVSKHMDVKDSVRSDGLTEGSVCHNKVIGVYSFDKCFPDINDVQLEAAQLNGIAPVHTREEAQMLVASNKLVNISNSPFYTVDDLSHSMPYLVPKAQQLLNTISVNFIDSLRSKGMPPHLLMVTSVLRTGSDVRRLQRGNVNATTNSCHCYGTTVDIAYNRFVPVMGHYNEDVRKLTRWDFEMKLVLSEVLYDLRKQGLCYVKYERKQGCFHLTAR